MKQATNEAQEVINDLENETTPIYSDGYSIVNRFFGTLTIELKNYYIDLYINCYQNSLDLSGKIEVNELTYALIENETETEVVISDEQNEELEQAIIKTLKFS